MSIVQLLEIFGLKKDKIIIFKRFRFGSIRHDLILSANLVRSIISDDFVRPIISIDLVSGS